MSHDNYSPSARVYNHIVGMVYLQEHLQRAMSLKKRISVMS